MITADQLLCHAIGDYLLQSHWMATKKTASFLTAFAHILTYGLPFLFLDTSAIAYFAIVGSHFVIDRWRLARYLVWLKNHLAPVDSVELKQTPNTVEAQSPDGYVNQYVIVKWWRPWRECQATGYPPDVPPWLATWLLIIADNILHIICNGLALKHL